MNLYLDDDSAKTKLVAILRRAGHRVWTPAECGMVGVSDARHFEYARLAAYRCPDSPAGLPEPLGTRHAPEGFQQFGNERAFRQCTATLAFLCGHMISGIPRSKTERYSEFALCPSILLDFLSIRRELFI